MLFDNQYLSKIKNSVTLIVVELSTFYANKLITQQ